ncbi:MAG: hypothetical protein KAH32_02255 [Chlamydiia bacterium]|nr:hypothetical protein [Chlamydiia bacterium]
MLALIKNKITNRTNIIRFLWLMEGPVYTSLIVLIPQIALSSYSVDKRIVSYIIAIAALGGYLVGSINLSYLNKYLQRSLVLLLITRRVLLLITIMLMPYKYLMLPLFLICCSLNSAIGKLWIETTRRGNLSDKYSQEISISHLCSYFSSIVILQILKDVELVNVSLSSICIVIIILTFIMQIPSLYVLYKSYSKDPCISNISDHMPSPDKSPDKDVVKYRYSKTEKILFYAIFVMAGWTITLSYPLINITMSNVKNGIIAFNLYKQIGQLISFVLFSFIINMTRIHNIFCVLISWIPFYICMITQHTNGTIFMLSSIFAGFGTALSQIIWSFSSIALTPDGKQTFKSTQINNFLLFCRGSASLVFSYTLTSITSSDSIFIACACILTFAACFSSIFFKKIS